MLVAFTHGINNFRPPLSVRRIPSNSAVGLGCCLILLLFTGSNGWSAPFTVRQGTQDVNPNTQIVTYDSGGGNISAFLARPRAEGKHPAVIVIHDNQGLNDGIRNVARQLAAAGFVALAPDLVSRTGGTTTSRQAEAVLGGLSPQQSVEDLRAGFAFLEKYPGVDPDKISSIGFGWGGWRSFKLAATLPKLYHAIVFYGATPVDGLENVHASVLANYAQFDFFDTGNSIWTEDSLKQFGGKFSYYIYPKTYRGFFSTDGPNYDAEAAKLAWSRTLEFLRS
jgi:carboxymethylenebutenolidase